MSSLLWNKWSRMQVFLRDPLAVKLEKGPRLQGRVEGLLPTHWVSSATRMGLIRGLCYGSCSPSANNSTSTTNINTASTMWTPHHPVRSKPRSLPSSLTLPWEVDGSFLTVWLGWTVGLPTWPLWVWMRMESCLSCVWLAERFLSSKLLLSWSFGWREQASLWRFIYLFICLLVFLGLVYSALSLGSVQFSSIQSLSRVRLFGPHELQHTRPPCPSPTPGIHSNSRLSSRWCHSTISSSVIPFSSCPQSLPASGSFPMTGWISLQSKGLSRVFFNTTVQNHQFFGTQLSSQSNCHIHTWPLY